MKIILYYPSGSNVISRVRVSHRVSKSEGGVRGREGGKEKGGWWKRGIEKGGGLKGGRENEGGREKGRGREDDFSPIKPFCSDF